ncbi:MAG: CGGC domain-containing protein [Acidaminococcaceae bacterium]
MKKIAILRCLKSTGNCTGASCLQVFNAKSAFFERYLDEDIQLVAFLTCNGCEEMQFTGEAGLEEKIERLLKLGTDIVHIGMCCETRVSGPQPKKCEHIVTLAALFQAQHLEVVWGTHY